MSPGSGPDCLFIKAVPVRGSQDLYNSKNKLTEMKKMILIAKVIVLGILPHGLQAQSGKISPEEKEFLVNFLKVTQDDLLTTISKVDAQQWTERPEDGGWSVADCMEHVIMAEQAVFGQVKEALASTADNEQNTKHLDAWLIGKITDRGVKVQTPLPPQENGKSKQEMIDELKASRENIIAFVEEDHEMRNHFGRSPYGPADAYQLLLVIAAHSMRHTAQVTEVLNEISGL